MQVLVKQKCEFNGQELKHGIHDLPDSLMKEWFFQALVKGWTNRFDRL